MRQDYFDHDGKMYSTFAGMCAHYHIGPSTFYTSLREGYSLEEALTGQRFFMRGNHSESPKNE